MPTATRPQPDCRRWSRRARSPRRRRATPSSSRPAPTIQIISRVNNILYRNGTTVTAPAAPFTGSEAPVLTVLRSGLPLVEAAISDRGTIRSDIDQLRAHAGRSYVAAVE